MARLSTYTKDVNLTGKDMLAGSNYVTTVNGIDQFETNNFTLKKLSEYLIEQINIDPGNLPLKSNGGLVYETTLDTDYLAIDLSATNITGQLANSDLVNSYITINGSNIELGGSIDIPIGDITSVIAGTYLNGGGTINDVTINHDNTSRSDTTSSPNQLAYDGTFTAITSVSTNATGHLTAINTATYTLPSSDETNDYVDSIAVTGTTTKTITLGRTGALSDLTATFDDNDTIPNDATITLSAGTYISGGGDFTTDQSANETITFNHDNTTRTDTTSSVGPNHGANFTVIDTLTSNATGHITAANVKTVTLPNGANNNTITLSAGTYLSGGGDFTVDQSFNETLTINHDSTTRSDTTSTDNNNSHEDTFTVVDSISTNATGHVTGINVKTVSFPADTNQDIDVNVSNLETRLGQIGNTSIGSSGSTITIPNLTVTGTQTINNVEVISTSSGIVFEGTSNDANETTLNVVNPTADRAINLPNKSGTVALLDDIPTVNDGTLTVQGSSGLTGSGTFTANDADSPTITISHADTSSQSSVNNSGNTFIQDITVDTYGHITGITSGTATDNDTITQIREDNGSYRTGSITLQSGTNVTITEPSTGVFNFAATDTNTTYSAGSGLDLNGTVFSHTDTSSQGSVNNSGRTYIQDITLDTYGHVTGLTSATETVTDTNTTYDLAVPSGTTYVRLSGSDGTTDDILITGSGSTTVTRVSGSALQISSTDTNTIPNNGLLDINQGTDISLAITGGDFTADKSTETDIVINHANIGRTNTTSTAAPAHGATFTAVDSITTSSTGHVTAVNTKTVTIPNESNPTVNNGTLTINTAGIASGSGTFTANQAGNSTITITATEADTLATVTGRGASTTTQLFFDGGFDSHPIMLSGAQNFDNIDRSGFYNLYNTSSGSTNSPPLTYGTMIAIGNDKGSLGFGLQIAHERTNAGMYVRGMNDSGSTWSSWAEIWTSLTDGSGSGLDADMLDGLHASSFLTSESDTLATVTARGNTTSATISVNQVIATNNGNGTNYRIGDDVWIGDINIANTFRVQGVQDSTKGYITFGSSSNAALGRAGTGALTWDSNTIWHSGNDGAGTGLDADLLDGVQGNQYLRSTTSPGTPGTNANTTISIGDNGTSYAYVQSHGSKPLNFNPSGNTVQIAGNRILTTLDINYLSYSGSNNFIVYGSQNNLGSNIPTNAIIVYQDASASQIVSRGYVSDLPFLTSYTETDTLGTVTSRGNTTGLLKVETGSIGESNAGTAGLIINGNYTNGQYSHRWRKQDPGGNVPLYLDQSGSTANSYTWQARFGTYSGNSITFEVNGSIKANGDMHCNRLYDSNTTYYFDGGDTGDSIRVAGDIIAYYSSDKRYKDNIINISNPLDKINKIGGYTFEWNEVSHKETGKKDIGVIAQEIEEVFPEIVQTRENGYKAVDYPKLTALLIEAVKELSDKVKALENGITK